MTEHHHGYLLIFVEVYADDLSPLRQPVADTGSVLLTSSGRVGHAGPAQGVIWDGRGVVLGTVDADLDLSALVRRIDGVDLSGPEREVLAVLHLAIYMRQKAVVDFIKIVPT